MEAILHIGTEKTGSTTIQSFLNLNRESFRHEGVLIPLSLGQTNHRLLPGIVSDDDYIDDLFRLRGLLDREARREAKARWRKQFLKEVRMADLPRTVISSEHLQSRLQTEDDLLRLRDLLGEVFDRIRICIYLRAPIMTAVSLYSTAVKYGSTSKRVPGPDTPYFRNIVDHRSTLQRWSAVFGRENITVRIFDRQEFEGGNLIDDFISACDLPRLEFERPEIENESLNHIGLSILCRMNRHVPEFTDEGLANSHRASIIPFFEKHFSEGPLLVADSDLIRAYEREFADSDEWVRAHFFPEKDRLFPPYEKHLKNPEGGRAIQDGELQQIVDAMTDLWLSRG